MSFSSEVKKELLNQICENCCTFAQNYALLLYGRAFSGSEISFMTENPEIIDAYKKAVLYFAESDVDIKLSDAGKYSITINDYNIINIIHEKLSSDSKSFKRRINFAMLANDCCFSAFVRGVFLACGTVTDPEKEYHLEFSVPTKGLCDDLIKIFDELSPNPKTTVRSGAYIVYIKNSADIEDLLSIMGATENSLSLMGTKMYKDVRNRINRKVNFESANLKRSIAASNKQYEAIEYIKNNIGLDSLPEDLKQLALLRYQYRELSNSEITKLLNESISVSGVNHRFQRIIKTADELKSKKE